MHFCDGQAVPCMGVVHGCRAWVHGNVPVIGGLAMIPHQQPPHRHHPDLHQTPSPTSPPTHAPCQAPPMHSSACPSTKNQIRPQLANTEQDYMILLLFQQLLTTLVHISHFTLILPSVGQTSGTLIIKQIRRFIIF